MARRVTAPVTEKWDWTEPLPRRSAMGVALSADGAPGRPTWRCMEVAGRWRSARMTGTAVPQPSGGVGDATLPALGSDNGEPVGFLPPLGHGGPARPPSARTLHRVASAASTPGLRDAIPAKQVVKARIAKQLRDVLEA